MKETCTIPAAFKRTALSHPEKIALQARVGDAYKSCTYGEMRGMARNIAVFLIAHGAAKGDRIAIYATASPEWGAAYLGIVMAGAVAVPIDSQLEIEGVRNILTHSGSGIVFVSEENVDNALKSGEGLEIRILNLESKEFADIGERSKDFNLPEIHEDDLASVVYTSGTTGIPKGVMLTHKNFCFDAFSIIEEGLVSGDDKVLGVLPLHHTYPFMTTIIAPLFAGATVTYLTVLKGPEIVKTMKECGITILIGVPQLFEMIVRGINSKMGNPVLKGLAYICGFLRRRTGLNLGKIIFMKVHKNLGPNLRFFASGGAKLDPDVAWGLFSLGFTVLEGYGLTETSPVATFNPEKKAKIGSVGLPIPGVEIKILSPDRDGIGEIAIKGPIVMKGYYKSPEETADVMREGWFLTGDLGYMDGDGYLFITGRSKEVIVLSSGKNIYPEEIEKYYMNAPIIKEMCVVGVEKGGVTENIQAVIVPNLDYLKEKKVANVSDSVKWEINAISAKLPSYKRIMGYRILTEPLPRTPLGKIRRFMVAELVKEGKRLEKMEITTEDRILLNSTFSQKMIEYLKGITKKDVINLDDNLELDLGIDSLQRVEMIVAIEGILCIKLPEDFGAEIISVRDLLKKLAELRGGAAWRERVNRWPRVFEEDPAEEDKESVGLHQGIVARALLLASLILLKTIGRFIFRLEVHGLENLPGPPYIITPNHTSLMDGFVIAAAVPLNTFYNLYFVGLQEFFANPVTMAFARLAHVIPIDPEAYLYRAMQLSGYALKNNKALCLFPEGGRSIDGRLMQFKKGVGILSKELNSPLVPVIIEGAFTAMPRGAWFPRPVKIKVNFGKPIYLKDIYSSKRPSGVDDYEWIISGLQEQMAMMMRKSS